VGARDRPLIVLFEQDNPQERVMASRLGERWNWEAGEAAAPAFPRLTWGRIAVGLVPWSEILAKAWPDNLPGHFRRLTAYRAWTDAYSEH
jgi:hypothetical protein